MTRNIRTLSVAIATVVLVVGTYIAYEKYTRRSHVIAMVNDTSTRLRSALLAQGADGASAGADGEASAVEGYASTLRNMNTSSFRPLSDAADDYLVTSREILRRNADMQRARAKITASLDALSAHMQADRGASEWTAEAVRLKQALDKDLRDYRIAVESFGSLLQTLPASQAKVAPYVERELLIDEQAIGTARQRALDAFAATNRNLRQTASLNAFKR